MSSIIPPVGFSEFKSKAIKVLTRESLVNDSGTVITNMEKFKVGDRHFKPT